MIHMCTGAAATMMMLCHSIWTAGCPLHEERAAYKNKPLSPASRGRSSGKTCVCCAYILYEYLYTGSSLLLPVYVKEDAAPPVFDGSGP